MAITPIQQPSKPTKPTKPYATPAVRKLADQLSVPLDACTGTGVGGRIRLADVRNASDRRMSAQSAFATPPPVPHPDDAWFPGVPTPKIES
ncbi:E3 binding domain-containing protein [Actinomycetospora soli]|uniref:E3 binding domain-containing protein n=1 Tax=Actinomycetospora soli TaxID=2893887 RepID=UPI001E4EC0B8|nr:E3 binding domain-containing protein [Actinomycetospora soli]MCD2191675.1 E3 binding domain-containing protein [Actinomycetospora soli]